MNKINKTIELRNNKVIDKSIFILDTYTKCHNKLYEGRAAHSDVAWIITSAGLEIV